jgi:hypothetical protein
MQCLVCRLTGFNCAHAKLHAAVVGKLYRIADEVGHHLTQPHLVAKQLPWHVRRDVVVENQLLLVRHDIEAPYAGA